MLMQSLILGLAALAAAAPTTSDCPIETTRTITQPGIETFYATVTSTTKGTTYTDKVPSYTSTKIITRPETTKTITQSTGTQPAVKTETSIKCTGTSTK